MKKFKSKKITYAQAINDALNQSMKKDKDIYVVGQLVDYSSGVFGTTTGLVDKFGRARILDFPVAESLMTSMSIGMALKKKKVVLVHHRIDFMLYSMDAIVNWISLWRFKSNSETSLPIVIRAIVGKGWGQGPQHSKSFHSWFANLPGIRVALPSNPIDAKGLLIDSIFSNCPTIIIEHRSLFNDMQQVPDEMYRIPFGKASILKKGNDLSIVCIGYLSKIALKISEEIWHSHKIDVEVLDLRTISPIDKNTIIKSAKKTKKIIILDPSWKSFGSSSELLSLIYENIGKEKNIKIKRLTYPDSHTPASFSLEKEFYLDEKKIKKEILKICQKIRK
jgi:pyruvate/2-oxoglutarate/acetoin dehydrogenase E1 component